MPTFFEQLQELENIEPKLEMDKIEILKKYHDCITVLLRMMRDNPALMLIAQQTNLYDFLLAKFKDTEELLNRYHHHQIANKRN